MPLKIQNSQAEPGKIVYGRLCVDAVQIPLILAAGKKDGPTLVLHCAQHRTEYAGSTAVPRLLSGLDLAALRGTVVALPLVDVPAIYATRLREAYAEQAKDMAQYAHQLRQNINRVWPGDASGSWVDRLAHTISEEVFAKADAVLDFHSARLCDHPFTSYAAEHAPSREIAFAFGLRVVDETGFDVPPAGQVHKAIPLHYQVPAILIETSPASSVVHESSVEAMHRGMLNVMKHLGMLAGKPELPAEQILFRRSDAVHIFRSQHVGFFVWHRGPGSIVQKGDLIGEVRDISTFNVLQECVAPFDGGLPSVGPDQSQVVMPGEQLATLKRVVEIRRNDEAAT